MAPETPTETTPLQKLQARFSRSVMNTYGRFPMEFARGEGPYLWDSTGRRFLDMGGGIAVTCLGHGHPELSDALAQQARKLVHVSNLYYYEEQVALAERLVSKIHPGRMFFCNSGAEANECLFKLARRHGHDHGRFEILTAQNSFHGRTLAGIAATGQPKVKSGFGPAVPGFSHVPFNDVDAIEATITPATAAVLIEGIQGEGGIHIASPDTLIRLRQLCDDHGLLLLWDGVQCGHFRTGRFQSFQRILEVEDGASDASAPFLPDAIAMAKSLAGGFPMGAVWLHERHATPDLLGPGSHGTTFGGTPLACAYAQKILDIIERDRLDDNARSTGAHLMKQLRGLQQRFSSVIRDVRGLGLMIGVELQPDIPALQHSDRAHSLQMVDRLHAQGLVTIPSGSHVIRLLPPLNLTAAQADEGVQLLTAALTELN